MPLFHLGAAAQCEVSGVTGGPMFRALRDVRVGEVRDLAPSLGMRARLARAAGLDPGPALELEGSLLAQLLVRGFGVSAEDPDRELLLGARGRIHLLQAWELTPVRDPADLAGNGREDRLALSLHYARSHDDAPRRLAAEFRVRFAERDGGARLPAGWSVLRVLSTRFLDSWLQAARARASTTDRAGDARPTR